MGTHPIFESDFDCLTECTYVAGMDPEQKERNNKAVRKSRAKKNKLLKEQRQINNELDAEINDLQAQLVNGEKMTSYLKTLLAKDGAELTAEEIEFIKSCQA